MNTDILLTRLLLLAAVLCAGLGTVRAQQDAQYTQFTYDKLNFNPAYAGAKGRATASVIVRKQWHGFEGAPVSQGLRFHVPVGGTSSGVGVSLENDELGLTRSTGAKLAYSYHLRLRRGNQLALGLDVSLRQHRFDFSRVRYTADVTDLGPEMTAGKSTRTVPNAGAGAYFYNSRYYFGASATRLMGGTYLDPTAARSFGGLASAERAHVYLTGGYNAELNRLWELRPSVLVKAAVKAPASIDANVLLVYDRLFAFGATYRSGVSSELYRPASLDVMAQVMPNDRSIIGLAYDHPLSAISAGTVGGLELLYEYAWPWPKQSSIKCFDWH